jgi:hypothetical protein
MASTGLTLLATTTGSVTQYLLPALLGLSLLALKSGHIL